jgi:hypothetical protein
MDAVINAKLKWGISVREIVKMELIDAKKYAEMD